MAKIFFLPFLLFVCSDPAVAQKNKTQKTQPVIVVGKVLSVEDSLLVKQLFFDGLHEKMIQNLELATDYFKQVITVDPANDAAMHELAAIYHVKNEEQDAEKQIRNAVTINPANKWYWLLLADIYKHSNNAAKLEPVFDELIKLEPKNDNHYFDKANALLRQKKFAGANAVYDELEKVYGTSDELSSARQRVFLQQGKPEKVTGELEKQLQSDPDNLESVLNLAELYTRGGNGDKSIILLNNALKTDAGNVMLRLSLADAYRSLKKYDDAFAELKQAFTNPAFSIDEKVRIVLSFFPQFADTNARNHAHELAKILTEVHPDDPKSFSVFGDVLYQERKLDDAAAAYRKALKLNDRVYQIWEQLLQIEVSAGQFTEAIADGNEALLVFPNQAVLYMLTGIAYAQTADHARAITYLNNAASLQSDDQEITSQIYSGLGDSYHALKRYAESDTAYDKALEINPDNSFTLNNYAYYLSLRGENLAKAEQMSKRSIQLDPGNAAAEDTYAWILFKLKNFREAKTWIEKAVLNSKSSSAVQLEHYGDILYKLGETEKAMQQWQKAKLLVGASEKLEQKINAKKYIE